MALPAIGLALDTPRWRGNMHALPYVAGPGDALCFALGGAFAPRSGGLFMQELAESLYLNIGIARDAGEAYDFLCVPENFAKWASGLGTLRRSAEGWVTETPEGLMGVRFSERNAFGVLDHWVMPAAGGTIYVPLRVIRNGAGCELVLTLFRQPGVSSEQFAADGAWVMRDLAAAKRVLEGGG